MKIRYYHCQTGFSLLEIVVTLIVAAILGSMIYAYFASSVVHSTIPITNLKRAFVLHAVMENITADYYSPSIGILADLKTKIGSEDPNNAKSTYSPDPADSRQHYYVIKNDFISFNSAGDEIPSLDQKILKVTIKNDGGVLTALFTLK